MHFSPVILWLFPLWLAAEQGPIERPGFSTLDGTWSWQSSAERQLWFASDSDRSATNPDRRSDRLPAAPSAPPVSKALGGEGLDWDRLAKTYARVIRIDPVVKRITLLSESDQQERTIPWTFETEFYNRGAWGSAADLVPDQRVYVLATTGETNQWLWAHAIADEMSIQGMSRPYVLKDYNKEAGKIVLIDEAGARAPLDLLFDRRSIFVTASAEALPVGQSCYCNTRTASEGQMVMELLDATSFASEQRRRFQRQLETVSTNGVVGRVLTPHPATNRVAVLLRRSHSWIGRTMQVGDKVRVQVAGPEESAKRATISEVRPEYARLRVVLEVPAETLLEFRADAEARLFLKTPKTLEPSMPADVGRFTVRQDRIDYFLSTIYCTCGMKDAVCGGHWNTLAACERDRCEMPKVLDQLLGEWIEAGLTDAQVLDALIKREGSLVLRQHQE